MIAVTYYCVQMLSLFLPFRQLFRKPSGSFPNAGFKALRTSWGTSWTSSTSWRRSWDYKLGDKLGKLSLLEGKLEDKLADRLVDKSKDKLKMVVEPSLLKCITRSMRVQKLWRQLPLRML